MRSAVFGRAHGAAPQPIRALRLQPPLGAGVLVDRPDSDPLVEGVGEGQRRIPRPVGAPVAQALLREVGVARRPCSSASTQR